ncbi:DUF7389 domain-containing protein [Natrinema versiforme]|uniref:Gp13 n=1 Tax=Natrinema versiforme JCM 10478 TaxID=1227496 RepID=L9Y6G0_9EURY|nr:hypothetical protein [Natrinema versiforme]ELY69317.1 gp13 [Natrinema versiforme JCM 10478]
MSDDEPAFSVTTSLTRGTGTDDRDSFKVTVAADDLEELDRKLERMRERLGDHMAACLEMQPENKTGRKIADDQAGLDEVEA